MKPRDEFSPKGEDSNSIITPQSLESIANPMTLVHGYTQLLQRRLRRGQAIDAEELLRVLGLIEHSSRSAIASLAGLVKIAQSKCVDPGSE